MTRDEAEAKSKAADAKRKADRDADIAWNNLARQCEYPASADRALWRAVIAQAIDDATGAYQSGRSEFGRDSNFEKPLAREWLTDGGDDLNFVCELADVSADQVRGRARGFRAAGWMVTRAVRAA